MRAAQHKLHSINPRKTLRSVLKCQEPEANRDPRDAGSQRQDGADGGELLATLKLRKESPARGQQDGTCQRLDRGHRRGPLETPPQIPHRASVRISGPNKV